MSSVRGDGPGVSCDTFNFIFAAAWKSVFSLALPDFNLAFVSLFTSAHNRDRIFYCGAYFVKGDFNDKPVSMIAGRHGPVKLVIPICMFPDVRDAEIKISLIKFFQQ